MLDESIVCSDCKSQFTFTASESAFFASKGLVKPRRCKACRQQRRASRDVESQVLGPQSQVPVTSINRTQWVGGGELDNSHRNKPAKRRRDPSY